MTDEKKVTLGDVLDHLKAVGEKIAQDKPLLDITSLLGKDHHQTAVFLRFPYPGVFAHPKVADRINKFLSSINRPDTLKADLFTVLGGNCVPGFQPHIKWPVDDKGEPVRGGLFNPDDVIPEAKGYVLQITVDVVLPDVLDHALGKGKYPDAAIQKLASNPPLTDSEFVKLLLEQAKDEAEVYQEDPDTQDDE